MTDTKYVMVPVVPTDEMIDAATPLLHEPQRQSDLEGIYQSMLAAAPERTEGWQPIATAPKDGTEFQSWVGHWEPRCRIDPECEVFEIYGRVDYDMDGWAVYGHLFATHWMLHPEQPSATQADREGS